MKNTVISFGDVDVEITKEKFPNIFALLGDSPRQFEPKMFEPGEIENDIPQTGGHFNERLI